MSKISSDLLSECGTAGLEPVLAAGLDTLIPESVIYRIHRAELQTSLSQEDSCLSILFP